MASECLCSILYGERNNWTFEGLIGIQVMFIPYLGSMFPCGCW